MNTDAFLNGIASFQGGFNEDDANFARGEGPLPRTPIFQHQRTPASGNGGGGVGNIRTNLYTLHNQHRDAMMMKENNNEREKHHSAIFGRKALRGASSNQDGNFGLSRSPKRLRDTLIALREKEEKLYAKAAEMQRELLRRDPSKAIELGGASIFEALPPLGDDVDVLREEKAEEKTKEGKCSASQRRRRRSANDDDGDKKLRKRRTRDKTKPNGGGQTKRVESVGEHVHSQIHLQNLTNVRRPSKRPFDAVSRPVFLVRRPNLVTRGVRGRRYPPLRFGQSKTVRVNAHRERFELRGYNFEGSRCVLCDEVWRRLANRFGDWERK